MINYLNIGFVRAIFQKYYQPLESIIATCYIFEKKSSDQKVKKPATTMIPLLVKTTKNILRL
jgi:hypothetical protein